MSWAQSSWLFLLAALPLVVAALVWAWRARSRDIVAIASVPAWAELVPAGAGRARAWQFALAPLALLGIVLAAAGPQYGFEWVQRKSEGVSLVVVLDVSTSMDAQDVSPTRSERARREVSDLLDQLRGDLVGLVLFANGAFVRLPVTADYDTVRWALGETTTSTITAQGSSISGALDTAAQMLSRAEGSGKGIVLISDGEFHEPPDSIKTAVDRLSAAGIPIFALGVGEPSGAPIPLAKGGFKKDASGTMVLTKLDEAALRGLAADTGGAYVRAVVSDEDVRMLYADQIRAKLVSTEHEVSREKKWHERYQIPLALALTILVVQSFFGIGPGRAGKSVIQRLAPLAVLMALFPGAANAGSRSDGLDAFAKDDWSKAVEMLGRAYVDDPTDAQVGNALGQALFKQGRYREAQHVFDAMALADKTHAGVHHYNAGNAAYADGRLEEAANRFQVATKSDPNLPGAPKNEQAVRKEIAMRERQAQQPPESGDQSEGDQQEGKEQGEQSSDAQPGEGDPGTEGQPGQEGQPPEAQQKPGEQPGQQPTPGEEGEQPGEAQPGEGEPGEMKEGPEGAPVAVGEGNTGSEMSKEAAARLVDSVQDGHPRLRVGGRETDKDW